MRLEHGFSLRLPFMAVQDDGTYLRNYAMLSTQSACNHRAVKHIIRKWVKITLGRAISDVELRAAYKAVEKHKQAGMQVMHMRRAISAEEAETLATGRSTIAPTDG